MLRLARQRSSSIQANPPSRLCEAPNNAASRKPAVAVTGSSRCAGLGFTRHNRTGTTHLPLSSSRQRVSRNWALQFAEMSKRPFSTRNATTESHAGDTHHLRTSDEAWRDNPLLGDLVKYNEIANSTLAELVNKCEELEQLDIPNFDLQEKDGVFELKLGEKGTYVINKQTPNRQIWFSSPVSGPKRYNWDPKTKAWRNTRDGHNLEDFFSSEVSSLLKTSFSLN